LQRELAPGIFDAKSTKTYLRRMRKKTKKLPAADLKLLTYTVPAELNCPEVPHLICPKYVCPFFLCPCLTERLPRRFDFIAVIVELLTSDVMNDHNNLIKDRQGHLFQPDPDSPFHIGMVGSEWYCRTVARNQREFGPNVITYPIITFWDAAVVARVTNTQHADAVLTTSGLLTEAAQALTEVSKRLLCYFPFLEVSGDVKNSVKYRAFMKDFVQWFWARVLEDTVQCREDGGFELFYPVLNKQVTFIPEHAFLIADNPAACKAVGVYDSWDSSIPCRQCKMPKTDMASAREPVVYRTLEEIQCRCPFPSPLPLLQLHCLH